MNHNASTQLWIGSQSLLKLEAISLVQKNYCPSAGCKECFVCKQIEQQQFYAYMMLSTIKSSYSRSDLDTIFSRIVIARAAQEPFFCVITQADKLSDACANSLLKLLEEPPTGWHWLLLTDRAQELLPTVKSRCLVTQFASKQHDSGYRELVSCLTAHSVADLIQFHQLLDRIKITDYESRLVLDELVTFWVQERLKNRAYGNVVNYLLACLEQPPMPGSGKIFWRTVYLNMRSLLGL
jgi:DNA polymerase-3 subunit delta'